MEEKKAFKPTQAMLSNSARGAALSKSFSRGQNQSLISEELTLDEVKALYVELVKQVDFYDPLERESDGGPPAKSIDFLRNGGSAGLAWCRLILKQQGILKTYSKEVTQEELAKEEKIKGFEWKIEKSANDELMQVTYVAMMPDMVDLHGDFTSAEEVRKAMESFNKSAMRANLFHRVMTDTFSVIESYLAPTDFVLDDIPVKKGTWLMTLQVHDEDVWALIKSGDINGISIGAMATVEQAESEGDED